MDIKETTMKKLEIEYFDSDEGAAAEAFAYAENNNYKVTWCGPLNTGIGKEDPVTYRLIGEKKVAHSHLLE